MSSPCEHDWIGMGDHQRCRKCYARNPALPPAYKGEHRLLNLGGHR